MIEDLTTSPEIGVGQTFMVNGWAPVRLAFDPPLEKYFVSRLRGVLHPSGQGQDLRVTVLSAGLLAEKVVFDDIAFLSILASMRDWRYMCYADVAVTGPDASERIRLEHVEVVKQDGAAPGISRLAEGCTESLVAQLRDKLPVGTR